MKLLIASQNAHKIDEIKPFLEKAGFDVTDARFHQLPEPEENGGTFINNARIKAQSAMKATGMAVLADDSGLVVEALGEFPGVDSAPYAKSCGGYPQAVEDLFKRLEDKPSDCYYSATLLLLFPDGRELVSEGRTYGRLIQERRGDGTFGYDPWFEIKGRDQTFAEISTEEKNAISHRGRAIADLLDKLRVAA